MSEVTKQDLDALEARMNTRMDGMDARMDAMEARIVATIKREILAAVELILGEMSIRFGEVNTRLDRLEAGFQLHAKQIAAGTKAIAGFTQWIAKADADYAHVITELADLKIRVGKLEPRP